MASGTCPLGTIITYNGITIELVRSKYTREPVYSQDQVDYLYTHWIVEFEGVYNPFATSYDETLDPTTQNSPTLTDVNIRALLSQPRQSLTVVIGDDTLLQSPLPENELVGGGAGIAACDANNGPLPKVLAITRVSGVATFHVSMRIETWILECDNVLELLSNRWEQRDVVDGDTMLTTKTFVGIAVFRTDVLTVFDESPDTFRDSILPPIQLGFKRVQIDFRVNSAQNAAMYQVVDQEQAIYLGGDTLTANGSGLSKFEGFYQESSIPTGETAGVSPNVYAGVKVMCSGYKYTDNWQLTIFALKIAYQKLQLNLLPLAVSKIVMKSISIKQALHARYVELEMTVMQPSNELPNQGAFNLNSLGLELSLIDNLVQSPDFKNPQPQCSRGTHQIEMIIKKVEDSCSAQSDPEPGACVDCNDPSGGNYVGPTCSVNGSVSSDTAQTNPVNLYSNNSYNDYRIDVKYINNQRIMQAPIAANPQSSGGGNSPVTTAYLVMAAPTTVKIVHWEAESFKQQPQIPNPISPDGNLVLLETDYQLAAPPIMPDGSSLVYRASGTFTYGLVSPKQPNDLMETAILPWVQLTNEAGYYGNFDDNILSPSVNNFFSSTGGNN